jgi:hypothetical protein
VPVGGNALEARWSVVGAALARTASTTGAVVVAAGAVVTGTTVVATAVVPGAGTVVGATLVGATVVTVVGAGTLVIVDTGQAGTTSDAGHEPPATDAGAVSNRTRSPDSAAATNLAPSRAPVERFDPPLVPFVVLITLPPTDGVTRIAATWSMWRRPPREQGPMSAGIEHATRGRA